ncbi:c-type cytochrome [Paenibacillus sp. RC67]|uniref:cytochrome c n=1 Tax=Paenibacillus sp. RC67 TaxID=3039392 RepID=UPI0024AD0B07|nr:c-type cytochrome [Paenibacillus sp. RC67]
MRKLTTFMLVTVMLGTGCAKSDQTAENHSSISARPNSTASPLPQPETVPKADPSPQAAPAPKSDPSPQAAPAPKSDPSPQAAPAPKSDPSPQAAPAPKSDPSPQAAPAPKVEPSPQDTPAPKAEPSPQAAPVPKSDPSPQAATVPKADSPPEPAAAITVKVEEVFKGNCMACHGDQLQGKIGPNLQKVGSHLTKEQILKQIRDGGSDMPSFASSLSKEEIDALAEWLAGKK